MDIDGGGGCDDLTVTVSSTEICLGDALTLTGVSVNGGTIAVGTGASRPNAPLTTQNVRIGRDHDSGAGNFLQGTVSVALAFNATLEDSALISFYQLYKDTLGQGLELP